MSRNSLRGSLLSQGRENDGWPVPPAGWMHDRGVSQERSVPGCVRGAGVGIRVPPSRTFRPRRQGTPEAPGAASDNLQNDAGQPLTRYRGAQRMRLRGANGEVGVPGK